MTLFDHLVHMVNRARENAFHTAVSIISNPTIQPQCVRLLPGPASVPDALYPALDADTHALTRHRFRPITN